MDFQLRPWRPEDLPDLVRQANNERIAANLTDRFPFPYTEESGIAFLQMAMSSAPPTILAIEVEDKAAGGIGLHPLADIYRKNAEIGYWLAEPYWNKGIMTRALREMVAYGFRHLDLVRIFARPFGRNTASQRILEKAGFTFEYKLEKVLWKNGQWEDEWCYGFRREDLDI